MTFHETLESARKSLGLSIDKFAKLLDVSRPTLYNWAKKEPSAERQAEILAKLARGDPAATKPDANQTDMDGDRPEGRDGQASLLPPVLSAETIRNDMLAHDLAMRDSLAMHAKMKSRPSIGTVLGEELRQMVQRAGRPPIEVPDLKSETSIPNPVFKFNA